MKKNIITIISLILLLVFSFISLEKTDKAFPIMFTAWGTYFLALFYFSKNIVKYLAFNISMIFFILIATEVFGWIILRHQFKSSTRLVCSNWEYKTDLSRERSCAKYYKDSLIYDVKYSTDKDGYRITPDKKDNDCVLIYGGSFEFGEGVKNENSMPYIVGVNSKTKVHNIAKMGYATHQMLYHIQNNEMMCKPKHVIYVFNDAHIGWANGLTNWGMEGPMYSFENDNIKYKGTFNDNDKTNYLFKKYRKSYLYKLLFENKYKINSDHTNLCLEIIKESKSSLNKKFPDVNFHVIVWDFNVWGLNKNQEINQILSGLQKNNIKHHKMTNILIDKLDRINKYLIGKYDRHPNEYANQLIANHITNYILEP